MVAGAAAQVAFEAVADLFFCGVGVFVEEANGGHDHAWCAVAALEAVVFHEGLLHGVHDAVDGEAFDGG